MNGAAATPVVDKALANFRARLSLGGFKGIQTETSVFRGRYACRFRGETRTGAVIDLTAKSWDEVLLLLPPWARRTVRKVDA